MIHIKKSSKNKIKIENPVENLCPGRRLLAASVHLLPEGKGRCDFRVRSFSCSVVSDPLRPHGLQHARLPCPSPSPGVCSDSCSLSLSHPLLSPSSLALSLSQHQSFPHQELSILHIKWPKYWSFSFSITPSNEYSGLISFRIDWFDLITVQGILKSILQHHSSKASILRCSAFFMVLLLHPHECWKNHSFDCMDLCWAKKCVCFLICYLGWS